jgi:hypothetical protein
MRIAILGWGSLLWEGGVEFDEWHGKWQEDGPVLKIEFSRISKSRLGALTLVIDDQHGAPTAVAWCLSKRKTIEDAICDLRCREGTTVENIGHISIQIQARPTDGPPETDPMIAWAKERKLDAVVWTALKSNFTDFSKDAAIAYLQTLDGAAKAKAAEYAWRAPDFVRTPLRSALQQEPWFSKPDGAAD